MALLQKKSSSSLGDAINKRWILVDRTKLFTVDTSRAECSKLCLNGIHSGMPSKMAISDGIPV